MRVGSFIKEMSRPRWSPALTARPSTTTRTPAYRLGAAVAFASLAALLAAYAFEYIGGYVPCPLCLLQRYPYFFAIPALLVALVLLAADSPRLATLVMVLAGLAFLGNAGLGIYHAGAEWKFWPGPQNCAVDQGITLNAGDLLKRAGETRVVRCDEAPLRILGLSFAGWNVVLSLLFAIGAFQAAHRAWQGRD